MRLIDADALKIKSYYYDDLGFRVIAESEIQDAPTVDAVPVKRGAWEERHVECENPWCRRRFYCTECGDWQTYGKTKYCQNCGAKMDGERREE